MTQQDKDRAAFEAHWKDRPAYRSIREEAYGVWKAAISHDRQQRGEPVGWEAKFREAVYDNLAAADNQDIPLEEYPDRILEVLKEIVGVHHPTVVKWRNDAIKACIATAYRYVQDPELFQYLKQDLQALITTLPPAGPINHATRIYNSGYMAGHHDTVEGSFTDILSADMATYHEGVVSELLTYLDAPQPAEPAGNTHTDDDAVDHFAAAMKDKLAQARAKGRSGWHECDPKDLSAMLRAHVDKGDPRDVANFCMFLWSLDQPISAPQPAEPVKTTRPDGGVDADEFFAQIGPPPAEPASPLPEPVVTKGGIPFEDQNEGIRQFKEACMRAADYEAKLKVAEPVKRDEFDKRREQIEKSLRMGARLADHRFRLDEAKPTPPADNQTQQPAPATDLPVTPEEDEAWDDLARRQ